MTTTPFDPSVAQLLAQTHEQSLRVVAVLTNGTEIPVEVVDYSIDWDETRTPFVHASFDCSPPADQATLNLLDPRTLVRLRVLVAYRLPSGHLDEQIVAYLHMRNRRLSRNDTGIVMTLDASSAEAMFIDALSANASGGDDVFTSPNLKSAVGSYLSDAFTGTPMAPVVATGPDSTTGPVDVPLAVHPWDALSDLADQYDVNIYDPGFGVEFVVEPRKQVGEAKHALTVGANGTILASQTGISRDDWANWVVVTYSWTTTAGVSMFDGGFATLSGGPYTPAAAGYKILTDNRQLKGSNSAGNRAAKTILARMLARSRSYTVEAVPAWWLRPGHTITLQLPLGNQERHLVSRIGFRPGLMSIETRLPDTASTIGE